MISTQTCDVNEQRSRTVFGTEVASSRISNNKNSHTTTTTTTIDNHNTILIIIIIAILTVVRGGLLQNLNVYPVRRLLDAQPAAADLRTSTSLCSMCFLAVLLCICVVCALLYLIFWTSASLWPRSSAHRRWRGSSKADHSTNDSDKKWWSHSKPGWKRDNRR